MTKESELRIGINIGKASREDRGITVYTRNILKEFGQSGPDYRFVLLHYPDSPPESKFGIENADLEPLPYSDRLSPWQTMIGEQVLNPLQQKRLKLDVIWHPHNRGQFVVPVGYVCTMHDILPVSRPELASQYLNRLDKKVLYASRVRAACRADMVITGSEFSRGEIIKHLGVEPDRVIVINYGIDRNLFQPNRNREDFDRVRKVYSLPSRYLLTVGSYAPHKNLSTLVDAFNQSGLPEKGVGLVMVGPNDATGYRIGYDQVNEHVQKLRITDQARLLASVPFDDLVAIYSNAEIFAIASLYEGFGFTPLEAMACEIPVVASNVAALPEICGDAVLYAQPQDVSGFANHFNALIEHEHLRQGLVSKGQTQVRKYDWQTAARRTLGVLESVAMARK